MAHLDASASMSRSASQGSSSSAEADDFQDTIEAPTPALAHSSPPSPPAERSTPPAVARRTVEEDNQTLAALAASSSASLPIRPTHSNGSTDSLDQIDPNSASFLLLASLRSQITDLSSQVTSLNSKLVKSYTQIGDLEDDLHDVRTQDAQLQSKLKSLEQDKQRWEREIEGGGWVERTHVQGEMQRLMAKVLEETKSRESAVQAHTALETEIDSLTSTLFDEANKMVVFERVARAKAEEKMKSLEEAGQTMTSVFEEVQINLRETVTSLEEREKEVKLMRQRLADNGIPMEETEAERQAKKESKSNAIIFSDGEHVHNLDPHALNPDPFHVPNSPSQGAPPRLLQQGIMPYDEFLSFIAYLRQLRLSVLSKPLDINGYPHPYTTSASSLAHRGFGVNANPASTTVTPTYIISPPSPAQLLAPHLLLSTHLSQPFLKRCVEEDSDPGLRLDLAPGLGFLSRRNVGTAIVDGTLLIEPLGTHAGVTLPSPTCSLCGIGLEHWWTGAEPAAKQGVNLANMRKVLGGAGGWSISNFTGAGASERRTASGSHSMADGSSKSSLGQHFPPFPNQQVHVFRVNDTSTTKYALCPVYCLPRLRAVCEFWTYVRVMERGLLLEENFKFVRGNDPSGSHDNTSSSSLNGLGFTAATPVVQPQDEPGLLARAGRRASLATGENSQGLEFDGGVMDSHAEMDGEDDEDEEEEEDEDEAAPAVKKPEMKIVTELAKEEGVASPTIPVPASPTSPALTQGSNASTSSVNKPPVPKRSGARPSKGSPVVGAPASPIVGQSSPLAESSATLPSISTTAPPESTVKPPTSTGLGPPPLPARSNSTPSRSASRNSEGQIDVGQQIVGGAMGWEDRCWAEVVKLKESIFWARMAAIGPAADGSAVPSRHAKALGSD